MSAKSINEKQLRELISSGKTVLADFWAPWCSYCRKISDAYDRIADQYAGRLEVVKINIDDNPAITAEEKIKLIPTLLLYKDGKAVNSVVAPESQAAIESFISGSIPSEKAEEEARVYDMIIVGGGPGGYTAALYAARAGLDTLVVERLSAGGQAALTHQIDNYPGFEEGVGGFELGAQMQRQAERFGAETKYAEVLRMDLSANPKVIETSAGTFRGRTVSIATGANPRELGLPNEKELVGKGVAYCAACDGAFYRGKTVAVIGGGNSAAADALLLSRIAKKVIIIHRRDTLRATKIYHEPLMKAENVEFRWNSTVEELLHGEKVSGVRLKDTKTGKETKIACDGVFVSIGRKPATELTAGQLTLDEGGYIVAGEDTLTNIPGVFAVGDVRSKLVRQVVTAVADGAAAVHMAEEFLAVN